MRITSSGRVGVGSIAPGNGRMTIRAGTGWALKCEGNDSAGVIVTSIGNLTNAFESPSFTVSAGGVVTGNSKNFKIKHPLESKKDDNYLVHCSLEAPQSDLVYRGKVTLVGGTATVNIDTAAGMSEGTFVLLCNDVQSFTTNETDYKSTKSSISGNILTITCENASSIATISWMVIGERKDAALISSDITDENGKLIVEPEIEEGDPFFT